MIMEEKDTELRDEGLRGNEKIEEAIAGSPDVLLLKTHSS